MSEQAGWFNSQVHTGPRRCGERRRPRWPSLSRLHYTVLDVGEAEDLRKPYTDHIAVDWAHTLAGTESNLALNADI